MSPRRQDSLVATFAGAVLALAALIATSAPALAQGSMPPPSPPPGRPSPELTPMIGYQWGGTLDFSTGGSVHANAAVSYGGALTMPLRPGYWGEINYMYQSTDLIARPSVGADFKLCNLSTQYIQLAGMRALMPPRGKATVFGTGGLGMTIFSASDEAAGLPAGTTFDTQYLFSVTIGGGVKVDMNERTAIRLQARALLPMNWTEGGFYFGTGGAGVGVSGGSMIAQGDATLGVSVKLGK